MPVRKLSHLEVKAWLGGGLVMPAPNPPASDRDAPPPRDPAPPQPTSSSEGATESPSVPIT